jgi:hypothetical protein
MFAQGRLSDCRYPVPVTIRLQFLAMLLGAAISMCWPAPATAAEKGAVRVERATTAISGDDYLLDAQFSIRLSSGAREALENNVPLVFDLQIQLVKKHRLWWDAVIAESLQRRQLEYHALSRTYVVTELDTGKRTAFRSLEDALQATGSLRELVLTSLQELEDGGNYVIRLRGNLDIESLPTPVRLPAYVSSAWDMDSEWYAWPLSR